VVQLFHAMHARPAGYTAAECFEQRPMKPRGMPSEPTPERYLAALEMKLTSAVISLLVSVLPKLAGITPA
jgi:hypothetical protein